MSQERRVRYATDYRALAVDHQHQAQQTDLRAAGDDQHHQRARLHPRHVIGRAGGRFPRGADRDRFPPSAGEITVATAGFHRRARKRGGVARGGAGAASSGAGNRRQAANRRLVFMIFLLEVLRWA